jgi:AcrR family transcriptional regulator
MSSLTLNDRDNFWHDVKPESSRRILEAAIVCFAARGYNATTTREIAKRAGMSPAAIYVHFPSKQALLYKVNCTGHVAVLADVRKSLEGIRSPNERLWQFMRAYVSWHARNHTLARACQYDLRQIPPNYFDEIRDLRRQVEMLLGNELRAGLESGDFVFPDLATTSLALLSLGIDVARWYTERAQTPDDLGAAYADLALRIVGANPEWITDMAN